jgi:DNA-binding IclR family transcriptional regulator
VLRVYRAENWRSAPDIAAQFGISRATVYRILAKEMRDK